MMDTWTGNQQNEFSALLEAGLLLLCLLLDNTRPLACGYP